MAISESVQLAIVHFANTVVTAGVGAFVFLEGLIHATPLTVQAVEYVATFGMYYGVHVYSSNSATKTGMTASNNAQTKS